MSKFQSTALTEQELHLI